MPNPELSMVYHFEGENLVQVSKIFDASSTVDDATYDKESRKYIFGFTNSSGNNPGRFLFEAVNFEKLEESTWDNPEAGVAQTPPDGDEAGLIIFVKKKKVVFFGANLAVKVAQFADIEPA